MTAALVVSIDFVAAKIKRKPRNQAKHMSRRRSIRHQPHFSFDTVDEFLSAKREQSGTYSLRCGEHNHFIDLGVKNRNSHATIVTFNGALSPNTKYLPSFAGNRMSEQAGSNLIAVADPSLLLNHGELEIAWHLGDKLTGPLSPTLSRLIKHLLKSMSTKRPILFGPSGGGYSAVNIAQEFPKSLVLAINPRLNMTSRPHPGITLEHYFTVAHDATSGREQSEVLDKYIVEDLAVQYEASGLPFDLLIAQNEGDQRFLNGQVRPFYEKFKDDKRLFLRFDHYSDTHSPIPPPILDSILNPLARRNSRRKAIQSAGFVRARNIQFPLR